MITAREHIVSGSSKPGEFELVALTEQGGAVDSDKPLTRHGRDEVVIIVEPDDPTTAGGVAVPYKAHGLRGGISGGRQSFDDNEYKEPMIPCVNPVKDWSKLGLTLREEKRGEKKKPRWPKKGRNKKGQVEAQLEEEKDREAAEPGPEPEERREYRINLWALQGNYSTRNFSFVAHDDHVFVDGTFLMESGKKVSLYGKYYYLHMDDTYDDHDKSRTVFSVKDIGGAAILPKLAPLVKGNNTDKLWASFEAIKPTLSYKNSKAKQIHAEIMAHYKQYHRKYDALSQDIWALLDSEPVRRQLADYQLVRYHRWEDRIDIKLAEHFSTLGKSYKKEFKKARQALWAKFQVATFLSLFLVATTTFWTNWIYSLASIVFSFITMSVYYPAMSDRELKAKMAERISPGFSAIPCAKSWLRLKKTTVDPSKLETTLHKGTKVTRAYETVIGDEEMEEEVDIFGTTINKPMVYPSKSPQNLEAALRIRFGFPRVLDEDSVEEFYEFAINILREEFPVFKLNPMDREKWLKGQYGERRGLLLAKQLENAFPDEVLTYGLFTKGEAYVGKEPSTMKPRMIWSAPETLIAYFGCYFHQLGKLFGKWANVNSNVFYASSTTPEAVGTFATRMYGFPLVVESDVSNWDGSMLPEMLAIEKYFLENHVIGMPEEIDILLRNWGKSSGSTRGGSVRAESDHGRRSGDPWTSLFNSLLNILVTMWAFGITHLEDFMIMVLGDDNCVALPAEADVDLARLRYESLGMKIEIIERATIEELTFCSGRFWNVGGTYKWGNMPFKVLTKLGINHHNHHPKFYPGLLLGTCKSLLPTAGHIPLLGVLLRTICDTAGDEVKARQDNRHCNPYRIQGGVVAYPTIETYNQFARIYKVDVEAVFEMEDAILNSVSIEQCPYMLDGDLFTHCWDAEMGETESTSSVITPDAPLKLEDMTYDDVVNKIPREEEIEKLHGAKSISDAIKNGLKFGAEEDEMFGTSSHSFLHGMFSAVSYINLAWGTALHSAYNHFAYRCNNPVCAKRKGKSAGRFKAGAKAVAKEVAKKVGKAFLTSAGGAIGGALGGPGGAVSGSAAGAYLAKLTGMGDYKVSRNTLLTNGYTFGGAKDRSVRVRHCEYIGDIFATNDFTTTQYAINPGLASSFPWVSTVADAFIQYRIHGMVYYFVSQSAAWNGQSQALGYVMFGTQYNVLRDPFSTKREMLNYEFSSSTAPDANMVHPIECDPGETPLTELYLRVGALANSDDLRFHDYANFTVATGGFDNAVVGDAIGELHVAYDIEFFKPAVIPGGVPPGLFSRITNLNTDGTDLLGPIQTNPIGNLQLSVGSDGSGFNVLELPSTYPGGRYYLEIIWRSSAGTGAFADLTATYSNATLVPDYFLDAFPAVRSTPGVVDSTFTYSACFDIDGPMAGGTTITLSTGGNPIVAGRTSDVTVVMISLPQSDTFG